MKTLLILCTLKLADGSVVDKIGREIVSRSGHQEYVVQFDDLGILKVNGNNCQYLDDPEDVVRHPELYYPKFQPNCGPKADEIWTKNPNVSWKEACRMVGYKGPYMD